MDKNLRAHLCSSFAFEFIVRYLRDFTLQSQLISDNTNQKAKDLQLHSRAEETSAFHTSFLLLPSSVADLFLYTDVTFRGMKLAGIVSISLGFVVVLLPSNLADIFLRILRCVSSDLISSPYFKV